MRILLTGGAGYIGSHTAIAFLDAGYEVTAVDNLCNSNRESLRRVEALTNKPVTFFKADVADRDAMEALFTATKPDGVVHFAGLKCVPESVADPLLYYRTNLNATIVLLETMRRHGTEHLIFSSSATVYGVPKTVPMSEAAPIGNCTNAYGWTKFMSEQMISDAVGAYGFSAVLLRYFNPAGAHPSGRIGEMPQGVPNNLMPYITQVAVGVRPYLNVTGADYPTPDGTGIRDYIHVMDLAEGHVRAMEYCLEHTGEATFNLGTGVGYSVLDVVRAFEAANGIQIPYRVTERRPGDITVSYTDPSKARDVLGWEAKRSLLDMCRDAWTWQRQNPNGYESGDLC